MYNIIQKFGNGRSLTPSKENQERKEPDWTWKIVLKEQRRIAYDDFNEESFFNALMEIING